MDTRISRFNWASLFLGIIALIAAVAAFRNPTANLLALTVFFGVAALVRGIFQIYAKFALRGVAGINSNVFLLFGIVNILFGIVLLANLWTGVMILPTVFAIWFIAESILGLVTARNARVFGKGFFWFRIISCILGVFVGFMLLADPASAVVTMAFLVGFYFTMLAIGCFVEAFGRREVHYINEDRPLADGDLPTVPV